MSQSVAKIRIGIQKSGRLSEESFKLLARCGVKLRRRKERLFIHSANFPIDVLLVRDDDIPSLVNDGVCDIGIIGTNVLQEETLASAAEQGIAVSRLLNLEFAYCRLALAVPDNFAYQTIQSLQNKRIATTYPALLKAFLEKNKVTAKVTMLSGSVEVAPRSGLADAICDLVSTGATLEANGLREVEEVFSSQAVLIQTQQTVSDEKQALIDLLQSRMHGVLRARESKYIMLHAPKVALQDIVAVLPGSESPTIMPLQGSDDKVVVHSVCLESIFWDTLEKLKMMGASSILVLPIEKMML